MPVLTTILQMNLLAGSRLVFFLRIFWKKTFRDKWHRCFMDQMPFLSPNQQCQITNGNQMGRQYLAVTNPAL